MKKIKNKIIKCIFTFLAIIITLKKEIFALADITMNNIDRQITDSVNKEVSKIMAPIWIFGIITAVILIVIYEIIKYNKKKGIYIKSISKNKEKSSVDTSTDLDMMK